MEKRIINAPTDSKYIYEFSVIEKIDEEYYWVADFENAEKAYGLVEFHNADPASTTQYLVAHNLRVTHKELRK